MAWQWKAKREIMKGWKWMRRQDPDAAADAARWAEEHQEEMREVDRILYRSDERHNEKTASIPLEDAEAVMQTDGYTDTDAFLPEDVRDRLYDDKAWYVRDKYLPDGFDGDALLHLPKEIINGLENLTELQREVIFRSIVNGEDVSSIAREKNCSARNIRDIRSRALKTLRAAATAGAEGAGYPDAALFILWGMLICAVVYFLLVPDAVDAWVRTATFIALPIVTAAAVWVIIRKRRNSPAKRLRELWRRKK
ncbi:MAG: hypothetical protein Q4C22_00945 [Bacillota bacterium]|nr:hypothetical protein [Bacillota bacterium]